MKQRIGFAAAILLLSCGVSARAAEQRIRLTPAMLLNETAVGDAAPLVDEQEVVGDPAGGKGKAPSRPFFPGWGNWQYPIHVLIDLGIKHRITRLFFYNETGQNEVTVSYGKPFVWQTKPVKLDKYKDWVEAPMGVETRYLRITLKSPVSLPELVVYGEQLESAPKAPVPPKRRRTPPPIDQFIGLNGFIDDPLDKIATPTGFLREYHSWGWDVEAKDGKRRFQPSGAAGGNAWFFDDYYIGLKQRGVTVAPVLQQNAGLFGNKNEEAKPVPEGKDTEAPASYAQHAAHLFQYAARYGSRKVDDALIDLAPGQPRKSGLGLLRYLENWNEPDKTWRERAGRFHPYELAAMSSADYDGHRGTLGKTVGIRNADPNMKLVMGGLAGMNLEYLRAMKFWADWNRDGEFPANVINLHHYSSDGDEQSFKTQGISPEADHLREKLATFVNWRDANLPDCELWLTEFGYDTNPKSPLHAPVIGSMNTEQVQAIWLIRSYLAIAAAGVDRAAMFMLRDVNSAGTGVFETCGLVTEKGRWEPKPSWFYTATLKKHLAGMRFGAAVSSGRDDVRIYRFDAEKGKTSAFIVWCPTSEDKHVSGFRLPLNSKNATKITFETGKAEGIPTPLRIENGALGLDVSETPIIILTNDQRPTTKGL